MTKVVIPAPYWRQPGHLGCARVERFIRWLGDEGAEVVVVRAGSHDRVEPRTWGSEVSIRDPIGFYRDLPLGGHQAIPLRSESRLRRTLAYLLLVPDPLAAWSRRVARHRMALDAARGADCVVASSPPESVHLAAEALANRSGGRLIVDLRDGWLDEPMIPLLASSRLQRWRHARLEARLLERAYRVLVTSQEWRDALNGRLPETTGKTTVLTNCCPTQEPAHDGRLGRDRVGGPLTLLYAGKLYSSRAERTTAQLLGPLRAGLAGISETGRVLVIGNLTDRERRDLEAWGRQLEPFGWQIEVQPPVAHRRALQLMAAADGLLLLSASTASIPAKLFDYLPSGRPILAVAARGSAVWRLGEQIPQLVLADLEDPEPTSVVKRFLARCREPEVRAGIPVEFSDAHARSVFLAALEPPGP
jgi:hypothetical protein